MSTQRLSLAAWRALCLVAILTAAACGGRQPATTTMSNADRAVDTAFVGVVTYQDVSGGFYGIVTDDGDRLDPIGLPAPFQVNGLAVEGRGVLRPDLDSIRMWGTQIEIGEIHERPR